MAYHIDEENSDIVFEVTGDKVAFKVIRSSGGGSEESSVYLIKVGDATAPTDQNVFSAIRSLAMFLRKDKPDSTDYLTGFNAGITIDRKEINGVILSTDTDAEPSDTSVYTSLSVDTMISGLEDKYIRKDRPDSTLYPVDFTNGLSVNSKRIGDVIRYYDEDKPVATDANIYSALQTDQRIDEEFGKIDDKYLRKDQPDTDPYHATFEDGITVYQLAELMNLDVKNLATIAKAVVSILRSSKFVDGFSGEGYQIWQDIATGDWNMTLDRLTVRKVLTIYELVLQKIRSVGGMVVVSAANGKVKSVERIGNMYLFTFEDTNQFQPNDLMRCQVFSSSGLKYYWVKVASVSGESVIVPLSEFEGVIPASGDECVLMGNTTDKRRQNLILISATEDGQPRIDCLDGVKSKSLEGCLKVRVGSLDGISDSRFPADMQPNGYGLYGNNCFLTGIFILSNGKDVMTMFAIMEGMIKSEISSVRNEINAKDNYLNNAAFSDSMHYWSGSSDIRIFNVSGKLLYFNNNFYSNKQRFADIVTDGTKNVLRLKNSSITQKNADLQKHPEFDLYDIMGTDADGNEIVTGQQYKPRMFYVSFKYKVNRPGTLRVYFKGEDAEGFENYTPINYTEELNPTEEFRTMEIAGKWNGTGDFYISFSGDLYLYSLALADNRLADVEEKFTMRFEATDKKIQANLDEIKETGTKLEEYHSEFLLTARNLQIQFSEDLSDAESRITEAYKSYVNLTARDLTVQFQADINNAETRITEAYTSAIKLSAQGLQTRFTADITDMEQGITAAYKSYVDLTAKNLQIGFSEDLTDLRTGITEAYTSAIEVSARGLRTDFNSSISDINGKLTQHSSSFHVTASKIEAMVTETSNISNTIKSAGWITTADGNELWAAHTALALEADNARILAAAANGKSLYDNPSFATVSEDNENENRNRIYTYNNSGGSAVAITRKNVDGVPNDSGYGLEIVTAASGSVNPGLGGFCFQTATKANRLLVCRFMARIPAGYTVAFATNATGTGGTGKWLTAHKGTGDWEEYAYYVRCGSSGTFSSTFFFYLTGADASTGTSRPVTWHLASANVYELSAQDLASRVSRIKQTVDGIYMDVYEEGGKFSSFRQTLDEIASVVGDGTETGNLSQIVQRIESITLKVSRITTDGQGNVTHINGSGVVTRANFSQLFSEAVDADGNIVSKATLTTYVQKDSDGYISGVRVKADQIDLQGKVTFSMFNPSLQTAINSKATTDDLNEKVTQLNSAIATKYGETDVSNAIAAFEAKLGSLAHKDAVSKAMLDDTVIMGGYLKTSLIDVDNLYVKHLQGATGDFTGEITATSGRIAGLKISGDTLTNEGFNNDACIILRNDSHSTFAAIGGNTLPASSGIRAVARFENEESNGYWGNTNVAMIVRASGATHNRAIVATGDILTNGLNVGYAFHEFSFASANKWLELAPVKSGIMFVYFNYPNCAAVLPTLQHVCDSLGISYGTPFAIRLTVISTAGENGKFYGRNKVISGTSGNQFPELRKWDGGVDETGYDFNPHDSFEVCLFYQGGTSYIPSIGNAYRAYITRVSR